MALLPIKTFPDPVLRRSCEDAVPCTDEIRKLAGDMLETMYAAPGIGLAAPQVGVSIRMVVVDVGNAIGQPDPVALLNPRILSSSEHIAFEEGCLSLPGFTATVARPARAVVRALDRSGQEKVLEGTGLLARALQHELDHLDGKLFVDRLRGIKRDVIVRKVRKLQRQGKW